MKALEDPWGWTRAPVIQELRGEARAGCLWNLFLPGEHGAGLTNLQYAPLAEITGRCGHLSPAVHKNALARNELKRRTAARTT
jgi:acyl-CoA dehydrogenase